MCKFWRLHTQLSQLTGSSPTARHTFLRKPLNDYNARHIKSCITFTTMPMHHVKHTCTRSESSTYYIKHEKSTQNYSNCGLKNQPSLPNAAVTLFKSSAIKGVIYIYIYICIIYIYIHIYSSVPGDQEGSMPKLSRQIWLQQLNA